MGQYCHLHGSLRHRVRWLVPHGALALPSTSVWRTSPPPTGLSGSHSPPQTCQGLLWQELSSRRRGRFPQASTSWAPPCSLVESLFSFCRWLCKEHAPRRERELRKVEQFVFLPFTPKSGLAML